MGYWNLSRHMCVVECKRVWSICLFTNLLLCWKYWIKYLSSTIMCLLVCADYNDVVVVVIGVHSCVLLRMWLANADWSLLDVMKQLCSLYEFYFVACLSYVWTFACVATLHLTTPSQHMPITSLTIHEHGPIKPTITWLQSVQKGRNMNVLQKYVIKFFQHNNKIVNEQMQKERTQLFELVYNLQLHTCT